MSRSTLPKSKGSNYDPKSRKEKEDRGKGDVIICPICASVYWYKSWHHNLEGYKHLTEEKMVKFFLCPACTMVKNKMFEGQVFIEHIPGEIRREIENLIYHIADRAYARDPMDRLLDMRPSKNDGLEIRTSENQLAMSIAKEVASAHKHTKPEVRLSKDESSVRVWVRFPIKS